MKSGHTILRLFFLCILSAFTACSLGNDVSYDQPPLGLYEIQPVIQNPQTEIWRPGYWSLVSEGDFEWVPGEVIPRPTPTATWSAAHWVRHNYGWTFEQGHWE